MAVADAPLTECSEYHRSSGAVGFDVDRCFSCFPLNDAMFLKVLTFLLLFLFFLLLPPLLLPLPPPPHHRALHPSLPPPVLSYRDYTTSNICFFLKMPDLSRTRRPQRAPNRIKRVFMVKNSGTTAGAAEPSVPRVASRNQGYVIAHQFTNNPRFQQTRGALTALFFFNPHESALYF